MKYLTGLILLSVILLVSFSKRSNKNSPPPPAEFIACTIVIDLTVKDKEVIKSEIDNIFNKIIRKLDSRIEGSDFLNLDLNLMYINDLGSAKSESIFHLPKEMMEEFMDVIDAKEKLASKKIEIFNKIDSTDPGKFRNSLYLETIGAAIEKSDEIMIVGDLAIEDGLHRFEAATNITCDDFGFYEKLENKFIDYSFANIPGQRQARISEIKECWNKALYNSPEKVLKKSRCF